MAAYIDQTIDVLKVDDVLHGLQKTFIFAILITLVGVVSGNSVTGGAEGVGRVTTRSVVVSITLIVIADMLFAFLTTR
jgi:phospholipid/cholesterol/gamma-HCH transport system permease protein